MMKNTFLFVFGLTVMTTWAQSPWTQKKGKTYSQLTFSTISGYSNLYGDPDYSTEREISDNTLQLFAEYGISDKTSLILDLPLKMVETGVLSNANDSNIQTTAANETSLGNIAVGIKHNFINKKWLLTGQLNVEANTSSYFENSGIRTGYDTWGISPLLSVGRGFNKAYLQGFTGVQLRFNDYSSNFRVGGEFGYKVLKPIWLAAYADVVTSFKNGDLVLPIQNTLTGLYVNDQEYVAYGLKLIGEIKQDFGVVTSFGGALSGNNVAKKQALNFGVFYKF